MRQVNLLPQELRQSQELRRIRNAFVVTLVPTLIVLVLIHWALNFRVSSLMRSMERPARPMTLPGLRSMHTQIDALREEFAQLTQGQEFFLEQAARSDLLPGMLKMIANASQEKVWFKKISLDYKDKTCLIIGRSFHARLVSEFMLELKKMPAFQRVELTTMGKGQGSHNREIDFQVICHLK